jgi:hypothetical protein
VLAREKKKVERRVFVCRNQNFPTNKAKTEVIKLPFVNVKHASEEIARVVPGKLFPRVIAEEFGQSGLLIASGLY